MDRYICIHGHFYQPPRENPWLEAVELEDSAYPYHDWNERITAECYAPNSRSRILDGEGRIVRIVNNYSRISFNFGPTLLAWMRQQCPSVYEAVREADRESLARFSGHGSALAQAYNHLILPLAHPRDKYTQILWGIRDFEHHFGRRPEGMWLPETAVDLESLEMMARLGIQFTILSPYQAKRVRKIGASEWTDVSGGGIDPTTPCRIRLRGRRSIAVFFYDGPISRAVAFEDLLVRGENLATRLAGAFDGDRPWPQLVHIATDGETYGHHRRHADMALAFAPHYIEANGLAQLTNYGEFLSRHPPTHEVEVNENSSWSCAHGVERWRSNCGCNSGAHPAWNQEWRGPLRQALDWLRDSLAARFEAKGREYFKDPWRARNDYIEIVLDRTPERTSRFLRRHSGRQLQPLERIAAIKLLEMQRHAMLMYTSCGWFFDELSGIETVQVIQYAGRALQLAQELFGDGIEEQFLGLLEKARSNRPQHRNGRVVYEELVRPARVDLAKVGAHYAISSLFEGYPGTAAIYSHTVERKEYRREEAGRARLAVGRARVTSETTGEAADLTFGVLHLGDQNVSGGVREFRGQTAYQELAAEILGIFGRGDIPELIRAVDKHFGSGTYSLRLLFRDEQRKIVRTIMESALEEAAAVYRNFYAQYATLARFVADLGIPLPKRFQVAAEFTINDGLRTALGEDCPDPQKVSRLLDQAKRTGIALDEVDLEFVARRTTERAAERLRDHPDDPAELDRLDRSASVCGALPFRVDFWSAQNIFWEVMETRAAEARKRAGDGDADAIRWVESARSLGLTLGVHTGQFLGEA